MPESPDLFGEVGAMRDELEEQGAMMNALVRASSPAMRQTILDAFEADPGLREVFRLIDGKRSQGQIVTELTGANIKGTSKSAVSRHIDELVHEGLISRVGRTRDGIVYKKSSTRCRARHQPRPQAQVSEETISQRAAIRRLLDAWRGASFFDAGGAAVALVGAYAAGEDLKAAAPESFLVRNGCEAGDVAALAANAFNGVRIAVEHEQIIPPEEIDSFARVANVSVHDVARIPQPLDFAEIEVKAMLLSIPRRGRASCRLGGKRSDAFNTDVVLMGAASPQALCSKVASAVCLPPPPTEKTAISSGVRSLSPRRCTSSRPTPNSPAPCMRPSGRS